MDNAPATPLNDAPANSVNTQNTSTVPTDTLVNSHTATTPAVGWDGQPIQSNVSQATANRSLADALLDQDDDSEIEKYAFTRLREKIQDPEVLSEVKKYERSLSKLAVQKEEYESAVRQISEAVAPLAQAIQAQDANAVVSYLQANGFDVSKLGVAQAAAPETSELQQLREELNQLQAEREAIRFESQIAPQIATYVKEQLGWEVTTDMVKRARQMFPNIEPNQILEAVKMANPDAYAEFKNSAIASSTNNGYNPMSAPRRVDGANQTAKNPYSPLTHPKQYNEWLLRNGN